MFHVIQKIRIFIINFEQQFYQLVIIFSRPKRSASPRRSLFKIGQVLIQFSLNNKYYQPHLISKKILLRLYIIIFSRKTIIEKISDCNFSRIYISNEHFFLLERRCFYTKLVQKILACNMHDFFLYIIYKR